MAFSFFDKADAYIEKNSFKRAILAPREATKWHA